MDASNKSKVSNNASRAFVHQNTRLKGHNNRQLMNSLHVNNVIEVKPPLIADEELEPARESRVVMSQLMSSYYSNLNSYLSKLVPDRH